MLYSKKKLFKIQHKIGLLAEMKLQYDTAYNSTIIMVRGTLCHMMVQLASLRLTANEHFLQCLQRENSNLWKIVISWGTADSTETSIQN